MTQKKKKVLYFVYVFFILVCIFLFCICKVVDNYYLFFLFVTILTTLTHFTIRIVGANIVCKLVFKNYNYNNFYFKEKSFEKKLYKVLCVKKWKKKLPTWNEDSFNIKVHSATEVLKAMCASEVYHLTCVCLSFLTILYAIPFGKFLIFFWTAFICALFDFLFVIIQRFNRPRFLCLLKKDNL